MNSKLANKINKDGKKKSKTRNYGKKGDHEVFVLPPHILQKLGIDLGNIQEGVVNAAGAPGSTFQINQKHGNKEKKNREHKIKCIPDKTQASSSSTNVTKNGSIMETANLMKESVFLSPTFVTADGIEKELKLSTISKQFEDENTNADYLNAEIKYSKNISEGEKTNKPEIINTVFIPANNMSYVDKSSLYSNAEVSKEIDTLNSSLAMENKLENKVHNTTSEIEIELLDQSQESAANEDHLDEAYLSDCSNSNTGTAPVFAQSNSLSTASKIKIIHEEVVQPSKINELIQKVFSPDKGTFIPVPINTIVTAQTKTQGIGESTMQPLEQSTESEDKFIDQICREVKSLDDINISMLDVICDDNYLIGESNETSNLHENIDFNASKDQDLSYHNVSVIKQGSIEAHTERDNYELNKNEVPSCNIKNQTSTPNASSSGSSKTIEKTPKSPNVNDESQDVTLVADAISAKVVSQINKKNIENKSFIQSIDKKSTNNTILAESKHKVAVKSAHSFDYLSSKASKNYGKELTPGEPQANRKNKKDIDKDKVDEIACYLSTYLKNRRSSLSSRNVVKTYKNRQPKNCCNLKKTNHGLPNIANSPEIDHVQAENDLHINHAQNLEQACKFLNSDFGKISYYTQFQGSYEQIYFWGERTTGTCEVLFEEVDFVDYVTSRLNDNSSIQIEECVESHIKASEQKDSVSVVDDNHVIIIVPVPEPTPSSTNVEMAVLSVTTEMVPVSQNQIRAQTSVNSSKIKKEYMTAMSIRNKKKLENDPKDDEVKTPRQTAAELGTIQAKEVKENKSKSKLSMSATAQDLEKATSIVNTKTYSKKSCILSQKLQNSKQSPQSVLRSQSKQQEKVEKDAVTENVSQKSANNHTRKSEQKQVKSPKELIADRRSKETTKLDNTQGIDNNRRRSRSNRLMSPKEDETTFTCKFNSPKVADTEVNSSQNKRSRSNRLKSAREDESSSVPSSPKVAGNAEGLQVADNSEKRSRSKRLKSAKEDESIPSSASNSPKVVKQLKSAKEDANISSNESNSPKVNTTNNNKTSLRSKRVKSAKEETGSSSSVPNSPELNKSEVTDSYQKGSRAKRLKSTKEDEIKCQSRIVASASLSPTVLEAKENIANIPENNVKPQRSTRIKSVNKVHAVSPPRTYASATNSPKAVEPDEKITQVPENDVPQTKSKRAKSISSPRDIRLTSKTSKKAETPHIDSQEVVQRQERVKSTKQVEIKCQLEKSETVTSASNTHEENIDHIPENCIKPNIPKRNKSSEEVDAVPSPKAATSVTNSPKEVVSEENLTPTPENDQKQYKNTTTTTKEAEAERIVSQHYNNKQSNTNMPNSPPPATPVIFSDNCNTAQSINDDPTLDNEITSKKGRSKRLRSYTDDEDHDNSCDVSLPAVDTPRPQKKRGRPKKLRSQSGEGDNADSFDVSLLASDTAKPQKKRGRPRKKVIRSSSNEDWDDGDDCNVSREILVTKDTPGRLSTRTRVKRLRSTLADYSSSEEVADPEQDATEDEEIETPVLTYTGPKKRGRKKKIVPTEVPASDTPGNNSIGDYNHDEKFTVPDPTICDKSEHKENDKSEPEQCGVCDQMVTAAQWVDHIARKHDYLAWRKSEKPVDVNDPSAVQRFLMVLSKQIGGFTCLRCGERKRYVQSYKKHLDQCALYTPTSSQSVTNESEEKSEIKIHDDSGATFTPLEDDGFWTCALCSEKVETYRWTRHSLREHYNLAWPVGGRPINIKSTPEVSKHLNIYKLQGYDLECKVCKESRVSVLGFYAHILKCGKTEKELESVMDTCMVCDKQYLCIYKMQHDAKHRLQVAPRAPAPEPDVVAPGGRRRAAVKARTVIKNLEEVVEKGDNAADRLGEDYASGDSDAFVAKEEEEEESEESGSDVESDASAASLEPARRNRSGYKAPTQPPILPYKIKDMDKYLDQAYNDFCATHYPEEEVFPEWESCEVTPLSDEPPDCLTLEDTSCQVKLFSKKSETFNRFEAFSKPVHGVFLGASPSCMSWVPGLPAAAACYLAVACFSSMDAPRLEAGELDATPALLQIWNFGHFQRRAQFSMGVVLPSVAWATSWCPRGASGGRLGLLAVACADGGVYVYSVPHPDTLQLGSKFCELKPVADLRISANKERNRVHPTAINWTMQNGDSLITVGYADGVVASYDLQSSSPLSRITDGDVTVFLPHHSERHGGCITGVSYLPAADGAGVSGATSVCGSALSRRGAAGAALTARAMLISPSMQAQFLPAWGSFIFTTDDLSPSELSVGGVGRQLSLQQALAGCPRCGLLAAATGARLRLLAAHPLHSHHVKNMRHNLISIEMVELSAKRGKPKNNTELEMCLEPLEYKETVAVYGMQLGTIKKKQAFSTSELNDNWERFPLSSMTSLSFCPAAAHHARLAVATHAGMLFIVNAGEPQ